ncbi:MAG: type II secretion system inner membrane protein GspF [Parvularcula sp.]
MTAFRYEAIDPNGRKKRGTITADSMRRARREIRNTGLTPIAIKSIREQSRPFFRRKPRPPFRDVLAATRQLATLIDATMPVEEALLAVSTQMKGSPVAEKFLSVRERIIEGWRLSDAMAEHPETFSELYRGIVASGQASGRLGQVMLRLADMQEKNRAMQMKAITSLIYPAIVMIVATLVVWGLMRFVVPKIVDQISTTGASLPLITKIVIAISAFVGTWGWLMLLVIVAMVIGTIYLRRQPGGRRAIDRAVLSVPIIGTLARELDAARFSRTLSTLFASGTPLLESLTAARQTVNNSYIQRELDKTLVSVREGASVSNAVRRAGVFPPMMASMMAAGERSGHLPELLEKTADQMEQGFDTVVTTALRLLEPMVIVILGGVVMIIVLAIMLPILQINTMAL